MSRYRRSSSIYGSIPTTVSVSWSMKSSSYVIKFSDMYHYNEMKILLEYMKSKPYGEYMYDPENKIWYLMEQHIGGLLEMIRMIPQHFKLDYTEKPQGGSFVGTFVSIDTFLDKFRNLTQQDLRQYKDDYNTAKKVYRRVALQNHPDRGGDSKTMSDINECWSQIEKLYFNVKKEPEYA